MSTRSVLGIYRGNTWGNNLAKFSEKNVWEITVHGKRPGEFPDPHAELQVSRPTCSGYDFVLPG